MPTVNLGDITGEVDGAHHALPQPLGPSQYTLVVTGAAAGDECSVAFFDQVGDCLLQFSPQWNTEGACTVRCRAKHFVNDTWVAESELPSPRRSDACAAKHEEHTQQQQALTHGSPVTLAFLFENGVFSVAEVVEGRSTAYSSGTLLCTWRPPNANGGEPTHVVTEGISDCHASLVPTHELARLVVGLDRSAGGLDA